MPQYVFGELLRKYRQWRGLSQQALAQAISYSRNMVGRWESAVTLPSRDTVVLIATALALDGRDKNELLKAAGYAPEPLEGDPAAFAEPAPPAGPDAPNTETTIVGKRGVAARDVGDSINTGDVYNYFIEGTQRYRPEFTTAIKNFLYNYLGDEKYLVPFGGRQEAWQQLEQWRLQAEAPPRLLLTAPAGRGKSALLVRWSDYLRQEPNIAVVFMPISIRFNTNQEEATFSLLATRLAHLYGKEIPAGWGNFPPSAWRRLVAEYLQEPLSDGRQLLVILDGLDEAAWQPGADLFPHQLPERVRLLLSARDRGGEEPGPAPWLRQLGWDRFAQMAATRELQSLTPAGVQDVLEKMGCPLNELGSNVDIVAELHRLSLGDPLLVELYVKDLWGRGQEVVRLQPDDLRNIAPGYRGYFANWMADQEKLWGQAGSRAGSLVMDILDVLAMALGPLMIGDLRQLLPKPVRGREVQQAIRPLNRLVIGDGQKPGYALAHPKLGEYFREELEADEQTALQQRFLDWGEHVLKDLQSGQLRPREAPSYLMQYYGRHLEEAKATAEELLPLVSQEWSQVWHEKTGTYAGFLQDVERVWASLQAENTEAAAKEQSVPYIGQEILCALCQASVNSLAANISDELLVALLQAGLWTSEQAIAYIRQRQDAEKRSWGFIRLVPQLPASRQPALWLEALIAARQIEREGIRASVLATVAPYRPEEVLAAAWELQEGWRRAEVLVALAPHLMEAERLAVLIEVLAAARELQHEWIRAEVLAAVASHQPEAVLAAARELQDEERRARVLSAVAQHQPEGVLAAARELQYEGRRAEVLAAVASHQPEAVLAAARELQDEGRRAEVLAAVAPHQPEAERPAVLVEALVAARELQAERIRAQVLVALAAHQPEGVLAAAQELQDEWSRARVLVALAPHQPEAVLAAVQELQDVRILAALAAHQPEAVLVVARELQDERSRAMVLVALAPHQPEAVLAAARKLQDEERRARVLFAVTPHLTEAERPAVLVEALAAARELRDEESRTEVLAAIAPYQPEAVLVVARELQDERSRARVLVALAPHQPEGVLAAARELQDEWSRARVLVALAPHQPEAVLAAARKLQDEERRARVLVALAPHQPEGVLAATQELPEKWSRAQVLAAVAPYQPEAVLAAARELQDEGSRAEVLAAVAPHQPEEVLAAARELPKKWSRAQVLAVVAPYQPEAVLAAARELQDEGSRAQVLAAVAPYQPEAVLAAARELQDEGSRAQVLAALAAHQPEEVLAAAQELQDDLWGSLARVLVAVAPHRPEAALAAAWQLRVEWRRAQVLATVAPHQPEEVLAAARELQDEWSRARVLVALAPYQPEEVLAAARQIEYEGRRAEVLAAVAPHRPGAVLAAARELQRRASVLAAVAPYLVEVERPAVLYTLWHETLFILSRDNRPDLLSDIAALMPVIHKLSGDKGVADTLDAVQKVATWWP